MTAVGSSLLVPGIITSAGISLLGVLPLDTAGTSSSEGRLQAEVNVLLGVEPDDEGGDVDHLFPHPDVSLSDEDSGVVDGLGQTQLEDLGLQTTLQKVLNLQTENIIQLHLALVQHSDPHQTSEESITLEQSPGVLLLQGQQLSGGRPDLGQGVLHPPHFSLVPQPVLADELELLVEPGLLEGPPGRGVHLAVLRRAPAVVTHRHHGDFSCRSESSNK